MAVTLFVPDIPEFVPLINGAKAAQGCRVYEPSKGYWRIEAPQSLRFERKALGLGPALWNSALTGGFRGRIVEYGRDVLLIESES
jgi:hypothetical protein